MSHKPHHLFRFGAFELDVCGGVLSKEGKAVSLTPKALQVLAVLVESQGRLVEKDELLRKVWPDTFVEEGALTQNVFTLRRQLGPDQSYIETVPRRGYRFVAPVETIVLPGNGMAAGATGEEQDTLPPAPILPQKNPNSWKSWIAAGAVLLVLAAIMYSLKGRLFGGHGAVRTSLAVLPMQNLTGDPAQEYLSDGLTEELTAQLGELNPAQLAVIARTSSMAYKGTQKSAGEVGRALGVEYIIESSVRSGGGRLRVTAQLIRVQDQSHMWAQSYEADVGDLLRVESEISQKVVHAIQVQLTEPARVRVVNAASVSPDEYSTYLRGRFYWNTRTPDGLRKSIDYYDQVLRLDPINAHAYAGLADSYNLIGFYGISDARQIEGKAQAAAEKALQLDPSLAEAHAALAYGNFYWWWKWAEAERGFRRALELNENYLPAHQWYALYLGAMGRPQESLEQIAVAKKLDPLSPAVFNAACWMNYFAGHYDAALAECRSAFELNPNSAQIHYTAGLVFEAKQDFPHATAEFESAVSQVKLPWYLAALGHCYAVSGKTKEAQDILKQLQALKKTQYVGSDSLAMVYEGLGNRKMAVASWQNAWHEDSAGLIWTKVDPRLADFRSDPWIKSWITNTFDSGR